MFDLDRSISVEYEKVGLHEHHDAQALRREVELLKTALATVTEERDKLRRAYEQLKEHLELLRRRIFQAKAERIDITQLELEFAETRAEARRDGEASRERPLA